MEISYVIPKALRIIFNRCAVKNSNIAATAKMDYGSVVINSEMGRYSYIGEHTSLLYAKVGCFTSISNYCAIGGGQHPQQWVSTSPIFNNSGSILKENYSKNEYNPFAETIIGNDVWIGANCLISNGVKIADGAIIGMGSVITKEIGAYEIWVGNPAKLIKKRFCDDDICILLNSKWWEYDNKKLKEIANSFNDIEQFKKIIGGGYK